MRTRRRTFLATGLVALLTIAGVTAAIANDPPPRIAFLANGIVPADALAAGPIAGQLGAPIFTTAPDHLVESTATALDAYNPQLIIVMGGPAAISDGVLGQVSAATGLSVVPPSPTPSSGIVRAAGEDRFQTAAAAAALLAAYDPAYLPTDMKAVDADKLDGKDSSAFQPAGNYLGKTEKAADSDKLDGKDSTAFLGKIEKAADADKLDGHDSGGFLGAEIVSRSVTETLADGTSASAHATCEAGEVLIGGGGAVGAFAADLHLLSSRPFSTGTFTSWRVSAINPAGGTGDSTVTAHAVCASLGAAASSMSVETSAVEDTTP